jgi:hypothetical protein
MMTWTDAKNARRAELIDKLIDDGRLSEDEWLELEHLQVEMLEYRRKNAPLPISEAKAANAKGSQCTSHSE